MAEDYIGLPPDGGGKKSRARSRTIGANTVYEQYVALGAQDTYFAYVDAAAFAASKHHFTLFNAAGSTAVVKLRKLFAINLQSVAVTGVFVRFDVKRCSAVSAGTLVTPEKADSSNAALPAQVTVRTGGTVTEGNLLFPWITSNDEETAVPGLSKALFQQSVNVLLEGPEIQELACRAGEGVTVKQITATTVGSYGWLAAFTVE